MLYNENFIMNSYNVTAACRSSKLSKDCVVGSQSVLFRCSSVSVLQNDKSSGRSVPGPKSQMYVCFSILENSCK